jgi:hypothetical protein
MTEQELDRLVAQCAVSDHDVERLDLRAGEQELLEEIMTATVLHDPVRRTEPRPRPSRSRRLLPVVAAAATVAAIATASLWTPWADEAGSPHTAAPAAPGATDPGLAATPEPEDTQASPRILVDDPDWAVTRVDEQAVDRGEMTLSDGKHRVEVFWSPAADHRSYFEDRAHDNKQWPVTVLGQDGTLFRYGSSTDFTTILPADGATFLEIRGDLGSREAYLDLVGRLERVDAATWADAMPSTVVDPSTTDSEVATMLDGVPVPRTFDASVLETGLYQDEYQLGAQVTGAVACAWLDHWADAERAGDAGAAAQAVTAMQTSQGWTVLHRMNEQGDYPEVVWEISDQLAAGALRPDGEWVSGLGCDSGPRSHNTD